MALHVGNCQRSNREMKRDGKTFALVTIVPACMSSLAARHAQRRRLEQRDINEDVCVTAATTQRSRDHLIQSHPFPRHHSVQILYKHSRNQFANVRTKDFTEDLPMRATSIN